MQRLAYADDILAAWRCETLGTVSDDSGNGEDLSIGGSGTTLVTGRAGRGLNFDGNGYASKADSAIPTGYGEHDLTLSCWFYSTAPKAGDQNFLMGWYGGATDSYRRVQITLYPEGNRIAFDVAGVAGSGFYASPTLSSLLGAWHHACLVRQLGAQWTLYLDGAPVRTQADTHGSCHLTTGRFRIAAASDGLVRAFAGSLDEIGVWDRALSAAEVRALWQARGLYLPVVQPGYRLEVWSDAGALLARLPHWSRGRVVETVNAPSQLEFTYPYGDAATAHLAFPNKIALIDRTGARVEWFRVLSVTKLRGQDGSTQARVRCMGLMEQLAREMLESYTATEATVKSIVADLLDQQAMSAHTQITLGKVTPAAERTVDFKNRTILQIIRQLWESVGGIYWVDSNGKFHWRAERFADTGQQIRLGKNLPSLEVERDYSEIRTKLIAYGKGMTLDTSPRIEVTQNTGTYGTITEVRKWPDIQDEAMLTALAAQAIAEMSVPRLNYRCGVIDLSQADGTIDYSHEALGAGALVTIVDPDLGEAVQMRILEIERDLSAPMGVRIQVVDPNLLARRRTFAEMVDDLTLPEYEPKDGFIVVDSLEDLPDVDAPAFAYIPSGDDEGYYRKTGTGWHPLGEGGTADLSDANPQDTAETPDPGDSEEASRANHVHRAVWGTYTAP